MACFKRNGFKCLNISFLLMLYTTVCFYGALLFCHHTNQRHWGRAAGCDVSVYFLSGFNASPFVVPPRYPLSVGYDVANPWNLTTAKSKLFAYMVQGPKRKEIKWLKESADRDVFWLTFYDKSGDIFSPYSTAVSGRNALLHYVVHLASNTSNGGYLYYVFIDDDIVLSLRNENAVNWKPWDQMKTDPLERFEDFLLYYKPAVGYVRYYGGRQPTNLRQPVDLHHDFDECFNAFHKDTLSFLLPYDTHFDYDSWYTGGWIARHHMGMLYHSYRIQCNSLCIDNTKHGGRNSRYKPSFNYVMPRDYIKSALLQKTLQEPNKPNPLLLAVLKDNGGSGLQPMGRKPGKPKVKGNQSYLVTEEFLRNHFHPEHPMVRKIRAWRDMKCVKKILNLGQANKREVPFIPDSLFTDSPSHFWVQDEHQ